MRIGNDIRAIINMVEGRQKRRR